LAAWALRGLEEQAGRVFLWLPVAMAAGVVCYFSLAVEPGLAIAIAALAGAAGSMIAGWVLRQRAPACAILSFGAAALSCAFALAILRTAAVDAPVLSERIGPVETRGIVETLSVRNARDVRVVIRPQAIGDLPGRDLPDRVRLRVRGDLPELMPGARIAVRAVLMPPQPPVSPGGYDFARRAYFDRIGAVGFSMGKVRVLGQADPVSTGDSVARGIERVRTGLTRRIQSYLGDPAGGLAAALVTGDRGGLGEEDYAALRDAGLAHLVAISGLHMGLVGGLAFFALRALLAAIPGLALHRPIKKWAALGAIAAAGIYLALSGAPVSAQRAFVMLTLVFGAVLVDRPALTMRTVALAAIVMIAVTPEAVLEAGFQMSFAAVIALIAAYEMVRVRRPEERQARGYLRRFAVGILAIAFSSVVAGAATAPIAAYHFGHFSNAETVANLGAMPLMSLWVMPAAMVATALVPVGLDGPAWMLMAVGLEAILWIGYTVSSWPFAVTHIPAGPPLALGAILLALLSACLWRGSLRLTAVPVLLAGIGIWAMAPQPDLLVGAGARQIAMRSVDGSLVFSTARRNRFEAERWLERAGAAPRRAEKPILEAAAPCDGEGCLVTVAGFRIAHSWRRGALEDDCRTADIVVAPFPVRACPSAQRVIDWVDTRRRGTHAVYLRGETIRIRTVSEARGRRPWAGPPGR
jgi:competence protein ComEC